MEVIYSTLITSGRLDFTLVYFILPSLSASLPLRPTSTQQKQRAYNFKSWSLLGDCSWRVPGKLNPQQQKQPLKCGLVEMINSQLLQYNRLKPTTLICCVKGKSLMTTNKYTVSLIAIVGNM